MKAYALRSLPLAALLLAFTLLLPIAGAVRAAAPGSNASTPSGAGVAWFVGDMDAAFALARRERRPLFLYWGAVWCPPCNQVRATVFNRQDFIERSRLFVPVYIDGDAPAAQKLGARFQVGGYPTMILFSPDGREITRLPGEVDASQYMQVLSLGINATRPVRELLATVRAGKPLTPAEWRLLAYYSWDTDEQTLVAKEQRVATLTLLAERVPAGAGDAAVRLPLKALAAVASTPADQRPPFNAAPAQRQFEAVLADPAQVRDHFSVLTESAPEVVVYLTKGASVERERLVAAWDGAMARAAADPRLSQADRLGATLTRVQLATQTAANATAPAAASGGAGKPAPVLAPALREAARAAAERADRETTDRYERQAVISSAAQLLREAGLAAESDAMLQRELARSPAPYYFMLGLAGNARARGDTAAALDWYRQAWEAAVGPATRLQWGGIYLRALIELAPRDAARIEATARAILAELEPQPETFHARNAAVLERSGRALVGWADGNGQPATLARLRAQLDGLCAKLPAGAPERATCGKMLVAKAAMAK